MVLRVALLLLCGALMAPAGVSTAHADGVRRSTRTQVRRGTRPARPQRRAIARARSQFALGVRQAERRRYWEAIRAFRRARRLHDSPAIRYNLAAALVEVGRPFEAYQLVRRIVREPGVHAMLRVSAAELERELERELVFVQVRLPRGAETLRLDQRRLPARELALSPGRHTLEALDGRRLVARQTLDFPPGTRATIPLAGIERADAPPEDPRPRRRRIIGGTVAAVVAMVAAGVAVAVAR